MTLLKHFVSLIITLSAAESCLAAGASAWSQAHPLFTLEATDNVAAHFPGAPRLQSFAWPNGTANGFSFPEERPDITELELPTRIFRAKEATIRSG